MNEAITGCLWAAAAMSPAACVSIAVFAYAASRNFSILAASLLAGAARLLLAVAASAIIIQFVGVAALWFVIWLMLFYIGMLAVEVYYAIGIMSRQEMQRMAIAETDGNPG